MLSGVWMGMLAGAIVLLCPVFLSAQLFLDAGAKKCYFSFYLMRLIKVYGGYATLYDRGIAFHLTKRKAVLLPYAEILDTRKKFEITRGFYILAYSHVAEIGRRADPAAALALCAGLQIASGFMAGYVFHRKKCASFKTDVLMHEDKDCLKVSVRAVLPFNLLIVAIAALKIALRKLLEKKENERKQAGSTSQ